MLGEVRQFLSFLLERRDKIEDTTTAAPVPRLGLPLGGAAAACLRACALALAVEGQDDCDPGFRAREILTWSRGARCTRMGGVGGRGGAPGSGSGESTRNAPLTRYVPDTHYQLLSLSTTWHLSSLLSWPLKKWSPIITALQ